MQIAPELAAEIYTQIMLAQKIVIISHRSPDADTIGSNLALRFLFESLGKNITSACIDPSPENCNFLPKTDTFIHEFNYLDFDLILTVDCGSTSQTNFLDKNPEIIKNAGTTGPKIINIDHHPSNNRFGTINLVVDDSASATLIIYNLFKIWEAKITPLIATCLLIGLYYDTGSFMHSNTNEEVLTTAAALIQAGADKEQIVKKLFKSHSIEKLKAWGKILNELRLTDGNVAVSGINQKDLKACNATHNDISGIIDYINMVKNNRFAALIAEDDKGQIRGSLRTRNDDVNVSEIAGTFGGGGHKKASGFTIKGKLQRETRWIITN